MTVLRMSPSAPSQLTYVTLSENSCPLQTIYFISTENTFATSKMGDIFVLRHNILLMADVILV